MQVHHVLHIGQAEAESLHVVDVARMHAIELLEHSLQALFLDADARVANREVEVLVVVPRLDVDVERTVGLAVFHGVVEQVVDHVLEVHLIDVHRRVHSLDLRIDFPARVLHAQREVVGDALHHFVQVELLFLERRVLPVEHRHLQHLFHEESQAFRLVVDHRAKVSGHLLALRHRVVVHHLRGERNAGDGRFQLVRHVVDEVVLDFGVSLLAEHENQRDDKRNDQHDGENDGGNHEAHRGVDVGIHVGEMHLHDAHFRLRVVAEEHLRIGVCHARLRVFRTAIDLPPVLRRHDEVIRNVDAVVHQFGLQVLVEQLEVDALFQRLVARGIENRINHLVEQRLLIDVAVFNDFLHLLVGLGNGVLVVSQNHRLRLLRGLRLDGFQHERGINRAVFSHHRILVALLERTVGLSRARAHGIHAVGMAFGLVHVFFEIAQRFVQLQVAAGLIESPVHRLVELLLLHLSHLADVLQLKEKQGEKRAAHDDGDGPDASLLHNVVNSLHIF